MRILGIDPGLALVGYGLIDVEGNNFNVVDYGVITTESTLDLPTRLEKIYELLLQLIDT